MGLYIRAVGTPKEKTELFKAILHPARFQQSFFPKLVFISVSRFLTFPQQNLIKEYAERLIFMIKYDQK